MTGFGAYDLPGVGPSGFREGAPAFGSAIRPHGSIGQPSVKGVSKLLQRIRTQAARLRSRGRPPAPQAAPARFALSSGLPDWRAILATNPTLWAAARAEAADGPRVLVATNTGGHGLVSILESTLAVALTLRGARVHTLLCDSALPACLQAQIGSLPDPNVLVRYQLPKNLCSACVQKGESVFLPVGCEHHRLSDLVLEEERTEARRLAESLPLAEIADFRFRDLAVGEHAYAGALRYFARGDLAEEPLGEPVLRRYLEAALLTTFAVNRLIHDEGFESAAFHHGIYIPQGIVGEACRRSGVRVANWAAAYRRNTFIFSHGDTYHHTLLSEPTEDWENFPWTEGRESQILDYLKSRWSGTRDWIWFHEKPDEDFQKFIAETGVDPEKPLIGLLTNVVWDAQLHYRANAFENMIEWVCETIRYFASRPDLQLLIRVHPAEIRGTVPSRQHIADEIRGAFPNLPANVFIIPPESPVSTYAAMVECDAVIIYGTKMGVELTSLGVPVIVAGEAWIRNKGLTLDAGSVAEYWEILDRLPLESRMDEATTRRARKYAYHFFFRRMIPLPFMLPAQGDTFYQLGIERLDDLLPGRSPGLDVICDGIIEGTPFIYPAETLGLHDA